MVNYALGTRTRLATDGGGLEAGPGGGVMEKACQACYGGEVLCVGAWL